MLPSLNVKIKEAICGGSAKQMWDERRQDELGCCRGVVRVFRDKQKFSSLPPPLNTLATTVISQCRLALVSPHLQGSYRSALFLLWIQNRCPAVPLRLLLVMACVKAGFVPLGEEVKNQDWRGMWEKGLTSLTAILEGRSSSSCCLEGIFLQQ